MAATASIPLPHNVFRVRFNPTKRHPLAQSRVSCSGKPSKFFLRTNLIHFHFGDGPELEENLSHVKQLKNVACGILAVWAVSTASPVVAAASQRLPPLSTEANRCERAFVGNTIGQANGVYDKPLDLRFCDYTNEKSNLKGKSLAAALMSDAKFDGADMSEVVMSKAYAVGASFKGVNFSNAVLDRVNFGKADLQGASFKNTVLSGSTFEDAKLEDVIFEDTIIGYIDLQKLCTNKSISEDGRAELGCR
ncbi:Pentapeptide repeat [Trema orientale]|uniref:Pentapeptide repeat n=1 Tax=Trema orientale TaxID=63057 RepID=A0A2P5E6T6_TREOI|nr:Pentapeptide repeat [Trema orientale]